MYYPADSVIREENGNMAENKGFEMANSGDYYDLDTEVNYQDLFVSAQDQAVVSEVNNKLIDFSCCSLLKLVVVGLLDMI